MSNMKNPVLFRKMILGISSDQTNKLYSASAAMVHHPDRDSQYDLPAKSKKQIKQKFKNIQMKKILLGSALLITSLFAKAFVKNMVWSLILLVRQAAIK